MVIAGHGSPAISATRKLNAPGNPRKPRLYSTVSMQRSETYTGVDTPAMESEKDGAEDTATDATQVSLEHSERNP